MLELFKNVILFFFNFVCIYFLSLYPVGPLGVYHGFQFSVFCGIPRCVNEGGLYFLCAFLSSFVLSVLFYSGVGFCFILLYLMYLRIHFITFNGRGGGEKLGERE